MESTTVLTHGLTTNEKRVKTYSVGIPKLVTFDIAVSRNRKSEKRVACAISATNERSEDAGNCLNQIKEQPIITSGSDDLMQSANNTTTQSESIEMVDQEDKLKDLSSILHKLAASAKNESTLTRSMPANNDKKAFVRSPDISPRRKTSDRSQFRRTSGRMTPILGSNRTASRTTPSSPTGSPRTSPRVSRVGLAPVVIPESIDLSMNEPPQKVNSVPSLLQPKKPLTVPLPSMRGPRLSLYDSTVFRRQKPETPFFLNTVATEKVSSLIHSNSSSDCSNSHRIYENDKESDVTPKSATSLQRTLTQYNRDIDGFMSELMALEENLNAPLSEVEENASFGDTYESVVFDDKENITIVKEEKDEEETHVLKKDTLYKVQQPGDLMPDYYINHDAVVPYDAGVLNLRHERFEGGHPCTHFCFHCDRVIINTLVKRYRALTGHKSDVLYGVQRCRIMRDINLCPECYDRLDLDEVIQITKKALKIFKPIYASQVTDK